MPYTNEEKVCIFSFWVVYKNEKFQSLLDLFEKIYCSRQDLYCWLDTLDIDKANLLHALNALDESIINYSFQTALLSDFYQHIETEGNKNILGSYYTPSGIVEDLLGKNLTGTLYDPCCGGGQFIISAIQKGIKIQDIYGSDIDPIAVWITKILIRITFNYEGVLNITKSDYIFQPPVFTNKFDMIATNPPWGVKFSQKQKKELETRYSKITSKESFSYFINNALRQLAKTGTLRFVLPTSILNVKNHSDIRKKILSEGNILKITHYKKPFQGVFTDAVGMIIQNKDIYDTQNFIEVLSHNGMKAKIKQNRFNSNPNAVFNSTTCEDEQSIIDTIFAIDHINLRNNTLWVLGVVTGNNKKHITNVNNESLTPIYKGNDIKPYCIKNPTNFIKFIPERLQQVANIDTYTQPKIMYRFISNKLICCYDQTGRLPLNSANSIVIRSSDTDPRIVAALFNSSLYNFVYQKLFGQIKILRSDLECLPIPILTESNKIRLLKMIKSFDGVESHKNIDLFIRSLFSLNSDQQAILNIYEISFYGQLY